MNVLILILLTLALVLALVEGFWPWTPAPYRPRPGWVGMACYFGVQLILRAGS